MGAGASIPDTEEEAYAQGYTKEQIESYKIEVIRLARENALKALELHKAAQKKKDIPTGKDDRKSEGKAEDE